MQHKRVSIPRDIEFQLVEAWKAGDRRAGERILAHYRRRLMAFFSLRVGRAEAEDLCQLTLLQLCRAIPTFEGRSSVSTFVYTIAVRMLGARRRTQMTRRGRAQSRQVALDDVAHLLHASVESRDPADILSLVAALEQLPHQSYEVIMLVSSTTLAEAAAVRGISVSATRRHYHSALAALRSLMGVSAKPRGEVEMGLELSLELRMRWLLSLLDVLLRRTEPLV